MDGIWRIIAIAPHHQQRCENYVQMAALIAKTLVGQGHRTWRAIGLSTTIRPINLESVEIERRKVATEANKKKIRRVSERKRVTGFARYMDKFAKEAS